MSIDNNLTCIDLKRSLILFVDCIPISNLYLVNSSISKEIPDGGWFYNLRNLASSNLWVLGHPSLRRPSGMPSQPLGLSHGIQIQRIRSYPLLRFSASPLLRFSASPLRGMLASQSDAQNFRLDSNCHKGGRGQSKG